MAICDEMLIARLDKRETELWEQGATLDLKASILLVAITFLAGQTTFLLGKDLYGIYRFLQIVSLALQFLAAVLCAAQLAITKYKIEAAEVYVKWRDDRIFEFPDSIKSMEKELSRTVITSSLDRIQLTKRKNNQKVFIAMWCYWITITSFLCNVIVSLRLLGF